MNFLDTCSRLICQENKLSPMRNNMKQYLKRKNNNDLKYLLKQ